MERNRLRLWDVGQGLPEEPRSLAFGYGVKERMEPQLSPRIPARLTGRWMMGLVVRGNTD